MLERYEFKNGAIVIYDNSEKIVSYNGKNKYKFNGVGKSIIFKNKKDELDGIIIKFKDHWNRVNHIVITSDIILMRKSSIRCFNLIPTLEKDKKIRIEQVENVKL